MNGSDSRSHKFLQYSVQDFSISCALVAYQKSPPVDDQSIREFVQSSASTTLARLVCCFRSRNSQQFTMTPKISICIQPGISTHPTTVLFVPHTKRRPHRRLRLHPSESVALTSTNQSPIPHPPALASSPATFRRRASSSTLGCFGNHHQRGLKGGEVAAGGHERTVGGRLVGRQARRQSRREWTSSWRLGMREGIAQQSFGLGRFGKRGRSGDVRWRRRWRHAWKVRGDAV